MGACLRLTINHQVIDKVANGFRSMSKRNEFYLVFFPPNRQIHNFLTNFRPCSDKEATRRLLIRADHQLWAE